MVDKKEMEKVRSIVKPDLCISAEKKMNIEELKELIFKKLGFIRVYCKEYNKKADMDVPLIMREGDTLREVCQKLHKDFVSKFKFARIWGKSAKFPGMQIKKLKHEVKDNDIVEVRTL